MIQCFCSAQDAMEIEQRNDSVPLRKPLTELTTADVDRVIEVTGARNRTIGPNIDSSDSGSLYLEHRGFYVTIHKKYWEDERPILELTVIGGPRASILMHNPSVEITDDAVVFMEGFAAEEDGKSNVNATLTMSKDNLIYKLAASTT